MNYFQKTCSRLADTLLPQRCALCHRKTGSAAAVCPSCDAGLPRPPLDCCPCCADFSAAGVTCGRCLTAPPAFDRVIGAFLYAEPVDRLIQSLKYGHQLYLAHWFGTRLLAALHLEQPLLHTIDAVIALPLHPARLKKRGFNQAVEIARPVARALHRPLHLFAATRVRDTAPQAGLPRAERQRNMSDAFECGIDVTGQTLLLIDDVLTTGSSAHELARILKMHGASRVIVAVAARTHHPVP